MKLFTLLIASGMLIMTQQRVQAQQEELPLWPEGKIPNFIQNDIHEKSTIDANEILRISGVTVPTITPYLAPKDKATGAAVMICPGGGYAILAASHEGSDLARWFNQRGISAFVLKYRLPNPKGMVHQHEVPLMDAMQGMQMIRARATEWNIDPEKVGVMGFSAGGHLAATLSTHHNKGSRASALARPNFSILAYPVISFSAELAHGGSRNNLLGDEKSDELIQYYSNELQIDDQTPTAFLVHSMNDGSVSVENSIAYYLGLKAHKIPAEMHLYPLGGHGYGLRTADKGSLEGWPKALNTWLSSLGYARH
ncbi:acetyl esterase/lipase [Dyadobacter jejuensis]|uniref:Acetyl esterase/lipase n=1 Tax=Dyadobacter jejuensis TaxID=1082580 RepID=A0A316AUR0_9BACT|nr:alpha/beta hydrolase [Dyadobacter jejuensis]PWJ60430.1 acetyl esterase/lipase [Dyadobacter jejuensis]